MAGIIPTGIWVMDEARSRKLTPAALTLWVLRDDGDALAWVSVETDPEGKISVNTFHGQYSGPPSTVQGSGFVVSLTSPGPRQVEVTGEVPGMGPFREHTQVSPDGKLLIVNGEVRIGEDVTRWYEEFNWHSASPHAAG